MFRRPGAWVGVVGLMVAACGGTTNPSTTTSTLASISTTLSPPSSIADAVVAFETGRQTLFEPNVVYRQDALLVPIEVSFRVDGWRSDTSREQLVTFLNTDGTSIAAAIAVWTDGTTAEDLLASLVAGADEATDPKPRTVGGVSGDVIDVRFDPQETDPDNQRDHPCDNAWDFKADQELGESSLFERKQFGSLAACGWSRMWVGPPAEGLLAVIGISRFDASPGDPGELSDLAPHDEDLLDAIVFCVGSRCNR